MKTAVVFVVCMMAGGGTTKANTYYVDINNATPSPPYSSWGSAANDIQSAVDQTVDDDTVLVAEGHYYLTSEIVVTNDIAIEGVDGREITIVDGQGITRCINIDERICFISGLTITGGYGPAGFDGAGIYFNSESIIYDCLFTNNITGPGGEGGGMYANRGDVYDCTFISNSAGYGGGLAYGWASNCTFIGNSASAYGGGMRYGGAVDCTLTGNTADTGGGKFGAYVTNCKFTDNRAGMGGGLYCSSSSDVIKNSTFISNAATDYGGGGAVILGGGTANNCTFSNNTAHSNGGGIDSHNGNVNSCTFIHNVAGSSGGGLVDGYASNCTFIGNSARSGGGLYDGYADRCNFSNNTANYGGGMSDSVAYNCLLTYNIARVNGGGMRDSWSRNCTIIGNTATNLGGGVHSGGHSNSIIWYNIAGTSNDIWSSSDSLSHICSPDVTHGTDGNITNAPLFIDKDGDNYRLSIGSPCINVGTNSKVYLSMSADLDGYPRIVDGTVDMGAYESGFDGCFITNCNPTGAETTLQWTAFPMWNSTVSWSTNLVTMPFTNLSSSLAYPINSYTDIVHGAESECFYKVELAP